MSVRLLGLLGLVTVVLAGCGIPSTDPLPFGEPARGVEIGQPVYFLLDGKLYPTLRPVGDFNDPSAIINALAAGPLPAEQAAGLTTELPAGMRVTALRRREEGDTDLTLLVFGGVDNPSQLSELAVDQLGCTAFAAFRQSRPEVTTLTLSNKQGDLRPVRGCPLPASPADGRAAG